MPLKINFFAVLVAVLVCFIIQMIWYTAIFAKPRMKEMDYAPPLVEGFPTIQYSQSVSLVRLQILRQHFFI